MKKILRIVLLFILFLGAFHCCHTARPEPVVVVSGLTIDTALSALIFVEREKIVNEYDGPAYYARVERYWDKDGVREYVRHPTPGFYQLSREEQKRRMEWMRDSVRMIEKWWETSYHEDSLGYIKHKRITRVITFNYDYHAGVSCGLKISIDTIYSTVKNAPDTVAVNGEAVIFTFSDIAEDNHCYTPDTAYLALDRLPSEECDSLKGYIFARMKDFSQTGDITFAGEFMLDTSLGIPDL
ncbi:MAG: hypothetical protein LUE26_12455 [Alistipes sp.]|nr:hypothetical protein [Alistipes sp.]